LHSSSSTEPAIADPAAVSVPRPSSSTNTRTFRQGVRQPSGAAHSDVQCSHRGMVAPSGTRRAESSPHPASPQQTPRAPAAEHRWGTRERTGGTRLWHGAWLWVDSFRGYLGRGVEGRSAKKVPIQLRHLAPATRLRNARDTRMTQAHLGVGGWRHQPTVREQGHGTQRASDSRLACERHRNTQETSSRQAA